MSPRLPPSPSAPRFRVLVTVALALLCLARVAPATNAPPNVILIVVDDLGAHDLGHTGSRFHATPALDRLAASGMTFTQAYAASTVCSPTRAAILTGKYPARLRVTDWIRGHDFPQAKLRPPDWTRQLPHAEITLAEHLRQLGYATFHLGKWHLGGDGSAPEDHGFDRNLGGDHRGQPPSYFSPYRIPSLPDGPEGEYLTDREALEAVRFIAASKDRPFFLNYWPYTVHTPLQAPADLVATHRRRAAEHPGPQNHPTYAAMIERLDAAVARILDALDAHGLTERTLIAFTSDNGGLVLGQHPPTSNAPLRAGKGSPYEGGHRVPLTLRWPGVTTPGSWSATPVSSIDLLPTLLAAVGATLPDTPGTRIDGRNLAPLLRDPTAALDREALFWHYPHYHPGGSTPYAAIRSGHWKLIQYYETGRHELYDLASDPGESNDLAGAQPERVLALSRQLFAWQNRVGAQWPMANPRWESTPIAPDPDGTVRLHARHAKVHGEVLRYEPQPFKDTLGWWTRAEDSASWSVALDQPGRFAVEVLQGCGKGSGGSTVDVHVADQSLAFTVLETGGFQDFVRRPIGEVDLPAGTHPVRVQPASKPGLAVMDLREVTLRPVLR
ncbi:MAG: sulfatase-like hydrolase/transferase [Verrucomicrobiae bacterium]|nr:sulfatase-like hydrolase/transferase [Verrucomicrobiae bacterium]